MAYKNNGYRNQDDHVTGVIKAIIVAVFNYIVYKWFKGFK